MRGVERSEEGEESGLRRRGLGVKKSEGGG